MNLEHFNNNDDDDDEIIDDRSNINDLDSVRSTGADFKQVSLFQIRQEDSQQ